MLNGGTEVGDVDVGYGPARAYTAQQTAETHAFLTSIDSDGLRQRFDSDRMTKLEIYPTIWDRDPSEDDTLGYLVEYFDLLREFVAKTQAREYGMITYLS